MGRSRRAPLAVLGALALVVLVGLGCRSPEPEGLARRIVLVTVDTLRADHVASEGGPVATPAFEGLAREGAAVIGACTPTPSTAPALASLLTGLHPWRHGVLDNAVPLDARIATLAEHLRASGRTTAGFVSSFIVDERFGLARGFDLYSFVPTQSYDWRGRRRGRFWSLGGDVVSDAIEWITVHAGEDFFVWVHLFDPHAPYLVPEGWALPPDTPVELAGKTLPPELRDEGQLRAVLLAYRGEVAYTDAQIGRLVSHLRGLDLLDTTAVVVTADHGEGLGDHGLLQHGKNLHDELVRVPLVVRAPGIPPGRRLEGPAQLEDLTPTLLDLAGAPIPDGLDGVNLGPWLRGAIDGSPREAVLGRRKRYAGAPDLYFRRRWPEKWIGSLETGGLLFGLAEDPAEAEGRPAPTVPDSLRRSVAAGAARGGSRALDEEARRALEALGYVE